MELSEARRDSAAPIPSAANAMPQMTNVATITKRSKYRLMSKIVP